MCVERIIFWNQVVSFEQNELGIQHGSDVTSIQGSFLWFLLDTKFLHNLTGLIWWSLNLNILTQTTYIFLCSDMRKTDICEVSNSTCDVYTRFWATGR
jgi:hypothetical protein